MLSITTLDALIARNLIRFSILKQGYVAFAQLAKFLTTMNINAT